MILSDCLVGNFEVLGQLYLDLGVTLDRELGPDEEFEAVSTNLLCRARSLLVLASRRLYIADLICSERDGI